MSRFPRRSPQPWRRSIDESLPPHQDPTRRIGRGEMLLVVVVIVAVLAMAIWFLLIASGGPGPGTV